MNRYNTHVEVDLVIAISYTLNISENEVLAFFDSVAAEMHSCPPNFVRKPYSKKTETLDDKVWILRGYYPNTGIFFRMTLIQSNKEFMNSIWCSVKAGTTAKKKSIGLDSDKLKHMVAENAFLDAPMPRLTLKPQRLFTPKGMKPFRLKTRDEK